MIKFEGVDVTELRELIKETLRNAGKPLWAGEIYDACGTSEPKPKFMSLLFRMKKAKELDVLPGSSPRKSLYTLKDDKAARAATDKPRARMKRTKGQKADAEPAANEARINGTVQDFIAAMSTDDRLILICEAGPIIFSDKQTQKIATLIFQHFDKPGT